MAGNPGTPGGADAAVKPSGLKAVVPAIMVASAVNFVFGLDTGAVTVALPQIQLDLDISGADASWVSNAFLLAFGSFLVMFGRVADVCGRRRVFIAGALVACVFALGCSLSTSGEMLFVSRGLLGIAAACATAAGLGIVIYLTPDKRERAIGMAIWGVSNGISAGTGLLVGGLLTDGAGWEWVFIGNLPFLIACAVAARYTMPDIPPNPERTHLDLRGSVLTIIGFGLLLLGTAKASDWGWGDTRTVACLVAGVLVLLLFVSAERSSKDPILPPELFQKRNAAAGHVAIFFGSFISTGLVLMALWFQPVLGYSATHTGALFLTGSVFAVVGGAVATQLVRFGRRRVTISAGLLIGAAGLYWLSAQLSTEGNYGTVALPMLTVGLGLGVSVVGATMVASEAFDEEDSGVSSGSVNSVTALGGSVGIAIGLSIMFGWFESHVPPFALEFQANQAPTTAGGPMPPFIANPWVEGQIRALHVVAGVVAAAAVLCFAWLSDKRRDTETSASSFEDRLEAVATAEPVAGGGL